MPTEEIVQMFNELRSDLVLLYELKQAHSNCEYEQQMLRHRYEALLKAGGCVGTVGAGPVIASQGGDINATNSTTASTPGAESQSWLNADDIKVEAKEQIIDVVGAPLTPNSVCLWKSETNFSKPLSLCNNFCFILLLVVLMGEKPMKNPALVIAAVTRRGCFFVSVLKRVEPAHSLIIKLCSSRKEQ